VLAEGDDLRSGPVYTTSLHRRVHDPDSSEKTILPVRRTHTGQLKDPLQRPERIKQTLLYQLTHMGQPFMYVVDGNYCNRGELYMAPAQGLDIESSTPSRR